MTPDPSTCALCGDAVEFTDPHGWGERMWRNADGETQCPDGHIHMRQEFIDFLARMKEISGV